MKILKIRLVFNSLPLSHTRLKGMCSLSVLLAVSQSACQKAHTRTCSACRSCGGRSRMAGWWNLSVLHAVLHSIARLAWPFGLARGQSVGLPEGACSHMFRLLLLRRALPNGRMVEPVSSARGAGNRFARRRMLAHVSPVAPAEGAPEWQDGGTCQFCSRCWQSVCQKAHARTASACRSCEGRYPNDGQQGLSALRAVLHSIARLA